MQQLGWLAACMKGKRRWFWTAMALAVAASALCIVFPFITQQITDRVLVGKPQPDGTVVRQTELLGGLIALMLGAQLLRSCLRYIRTLLLENVSQNVQQGIRHHLYEVLSREDTAFYGRCRVGDLMTRLTGDLDMVRHTIAWISFSVVESATLFIFSMLYLLTVNAALTGFLLLVSPVILVCAYVFSRTVYPKYVKLREKLSRMNSVAQENIEGNKTVRAFVREDYENQKFDTCNEEFRTANLAANFHWLKFYPVIEGCAQAMGFLVVLVGGLFIMEGRMTAGDLAAFSLMAWGLSEPMRALGTYLNDFQRFLTSANKIIEIYYAHTDIENPANGLTSGDAAGTVELKGVGYAYPRSCGHKTLEDISFRLENGQTLALLGPTGSGKTTLIDLITRMLDATTGEVRVDGINVKQWDLAALRSKIGVATQKVMLYSDTVRANIAYSNPAMPEQTVEDSICLAAAGFAHTLPEGTDTVIGEQGTGLSGGQKQRIALARALAKKPEILILDDTTSAVDFETEKQLRDNLQALPYPCTKIIVAQRISSVRQADCILVLDKGKIVQRGTHATLAAEPGYYRDICEMQGIADLPALADVKGVG
ncbi:MAG: ABC transporter ATP-binding protein [Gemmiger sp.]|nr:ABC transporter ATP-binding protein [Gemmiger sp.]